MIFDDHSLNDLLISMEAELAKGIAEIRHAQEDLIKAERRQVFTLAVIHHLKQRYKDIA